jgi:hypothetical protein
MSGFDMLTEFHRYGCLGKKGYIAVTRMLADGENTWHSEGDLTRWRHPMPLEWAVSSDFIVSKLYIASGVSMSNLLLTGGSDRWL